MDGNSKLKTMKQLTKIKPRKIYLTNIAGKIGCSNDLESDLDHEIVDSLILLGIDMEDLTLKVSIERVNFIVHFSIDQEIIDLPNRQWLDVNFLKTPPHVADKKYINSYNWQLENVEIEFNPPLDFFNPGAQEVPKYDWMMDFDLGENKCTISKR